MKPGVNGWSNARPLDDLLKSSPTLFRITLHGLLCIVSLVLGFRLSREALLVVVSFKQPDSSLLARTFSRFNRAERISGSELALRFPYVSLPGKGLESAFPPPEQHGGGIPSVPRPTPPAGKSSRVHVGRHQILVRAWPHPDPVQTIKAHRLMELVQREQKLASGVKQRKQLLVITFTYVRTFQAVHMTCLMHTLRLVPGPLVWIVIEAGGASNETAVLLSDSGLLYFHLGIGEAMPSEWVDRLRVEMLLRIEGLRFVRNQQLDGIVVFADDSNTYSLEFFNAVQRVNWIGSLSIGLLSHSGFPGNLKEEAELKNDALVNRENAKQEARQWLPIQGPVCNSTGHLIGWYVPNTTADTVQGSANQRLYSLRMLEWSSFVLNAQLLWDHIQKPAWIYSWDEWVLDKDSAYLSPLDMVKDASFVEPLGDCGRDVLLWWLRIEARSDSKFPSWWVINPRLEVVVPSKRTPWPELSVIQPPPPLHPLSTRMAKQSERHGGKQSGRGTKGKRSSHHGDKGKHHNIDNQQDVRIMDRTDRVKE
eukprot:c22743_g1_i1 orf=656-2263(-)